MARKIKLSTRLIYGTGDFYGGASVTIISMLFLFFLTDVVGLRAIYAGIVIFIGRMIDAVTDPLMGNISDKTRSQWGRRNPYFLFFAIPVGVSFGLLWMKVGFAKQILSFVYYTAAYSLFSIVFTAVMVPYAALAPELTTDYNERTALISTRMAFSIIGALSAAVIPKTIIDSVGSGARGYVLMSLVFGLVFVLIWFIMFFHMKNKEVYTSQYKSDSFFKSLLSCFRNKPFVLLIFIYLFSFIPSDILSANFIYYLTYYLKEPGLYTTIMGGLLICAALSLIIYVRLSKKLGKRNTYLIGAGYWILALSFLVFFREGVSAYILIGYAILLGLGLGVSYAIPWSMLPEVIDADEVVSGQRREGLYSGVMTFLRKLSTSVVILGMSYILDISGYISSTAGGTVAQPQSAVLAIKYTTAIGPIVFLIFALVSAIRFPINRHNYMYMRKYLDFKNKTSEEPLTEEDKEQIVSSVREITGTEIIGGGASS